MSSADRRKDSAEAASPGPAHGTPSRKLDSPRGLLKSVSGQKRFRFARYHPSEELGFFVEHYWVVEWDFRGQTDHQQESLPHPSVHIAIEGDRYEVFGVVEGRFVKVLRGKGRVFGIKFCPGGFYPFIGSSVSELTNRIVSLPDVFGQSGGHFGKGVTDGVDDESSVALAEEMLRSRCPRRDEKVVAVRGIVEQLAVDPGITKVDDLAHRVDMPKWTLQRLFRRYVGVSAKWVIQRYRLHEAIDEIGRGRPVDWARLAVDLGYFDQAHFIKDFKKFAGRTPDEYARSMV